MRCLLGLVGCLSLAAADVSQLRPLLEKDRIFQLREVLQQPGWNDTETLLYRAVVESRFGHETSGIDDLRKFLAVPAKPELERKAYEELASALVRMGRYGDAADALAQALRRTPRKDPDRTDDENTRALYEALKDVAPQTLQFGQEAPVEAKHNVLGSWDVPVEVNGVHGEWIFDTGANLSTISESEAARLGLATRETKTYVKGSTQKKNPLRLAVARELRFGGAVVNSVVLLVIPDQSLYIGPMKYQISGILGLPVLRALGSVGISAKGEVRFGIKDDPAQAESNLSFEELGVLVEAQHAGHPLQMVLDTGANTTSTYPSVRDALTKEEISRLTTKRDKRGGAGGIVIEKVQLIPVLPLDVLERTVDLPKISLLPKDPGGNHHFHDGVLGMDGLAGGFTLDFHNMQLRLD